MLELSGRGDRELIISSKYSMYADAGGWTGTSMMVVSWLLVHITTIIKLLFLGVSTARR